LTSGTTEKGGLDKVGSFRFHTLMEMISWWITHNGAIHWHYLLMSLNLYYTKGKTFKECTGHAITNNEAFQSGQYNSVVW